MTRSFCQVLSADPIVGVVAILCQRGYANEAGNRLMQANKCYCPILNGSDGDYH